jgi:hypothetical protein
MGLGVKLDAALQCCNRVMARPKLNEKKFIFFLWACTFSFAVFEHCFPARQRVKDVATPRYFIISLLYLVVYDLDVSYLSFSSSNLLFMNNKT